MFFQRYFAQKHAKEHARAVKADKRKSKRDDDEDAESELDVDVDVDVDVYEEDRRASGDERDSDLEEDEIWKVGALAEDAVGN